MVCAVSRNYLLIEHCPNCGSSNSLGTCLGIALFPQFASGCSDGSAKSGCDAPEVSVVKAADACASGDLRLASGPVFDDSMTRAILVKGIVDSIIMVISHVFANQSE